MESNSPGTPTSDTSSKPSQALNTEMDTPTNRTCEMFRSDDRDTQPSEASKENCDESASLTQNTNTDSEEDEPKIHWAKDRPLGNKGITIEVGNEKEMEGFGIMAKNSSVENTELSTAAEDFLSRPHFPERTGSPSASSMELIENKETDNKCLGSGSVAPVVEPVLNSDIVHSKPDEVESEELTSEKDLKTVVEPGSSESSVNSEPSSKNMKIEEVCQSDEIKDQSAQSDGNKDEEDKIKLHVCKDEAISENSSELCDKLVSESRSSVRAEEVSNIEESGEHLDVPSLSKENISQIEKQDSLSGTNESESSDADGICIPHRDDTENQEEIASIDDISDMMPSDNICKRDEIITDMMETPLIEDETVLSGKVSEVDSEDVKDGASNLRDTLGKSSSQDLCKLSVDQYRSESESDSQQNDGFDKTADQDPGIFPPAEQRLGLSDNQDSSGECISIPNDEDSSVSRTELELKHPCQSEASESQDGFSVEHLPENIVDMDHEETEEDSQPGSSKSEPCDENTPSVVDPEDVKQSACLSNTSDESNAAHRSSNLGSDSILVSTEPEHKADTEDNNLSNDLIGLQSMQSDQAPSTETHSVLNNTCDSEGDPLTSTSGSVQKDNDADCVIKPQNIVTENLPIVQSKSDAKTVGELRTEISEIVPEPNLSAQVSDIFPVLKNNQAELHPSVDKKNVNKTFIEDIKDKDKLSSNTFASETITSPNLFSKEQHQLEKQQLSLLSDKSEAANEKKMLSDSSDHYEEKAETDNSNSVQESVFEGMAVSSGASTPCQDEREYPEIAIYPGQIECESEINAQSSITEISDTCDSDIVSSDVKEPGVDSVASEDNDHTNIVSVDQVSERVLTDNETTVLRGQTFTVTENQSEKDCGLISTSDDVKFVEFCEQMEDVEGIQTDSQVTDTKEQSLSQKTAANPEDAASEQSDVSDNMAEEGEMTDAGAHKDLELPDQNKISQELITVQKEVPDLQAAGDGPTDTTVQIDECETEQGKISQEVVTVQLEVPEMQGGGDGQPETAVQIDEGEREQGKVSQEVTTVQGEVPEMQEGNGPTDTDIQVNECDSEKNEISPEITVIHQVSDLQEGVDGSTPVQCDAGDREQSETSKDVTSQEEGIINIETQIVALDDAMEQADAEQPQIELSDDVTPNETDASDKQADVITGSHSPRQEDEGFANEEEGDVSMETAENSGSLDENTASTESSTELSTVIRDENVSTAAITKLGNADNSVDADIPEPLVIQPDSSPSDNEEADCGDPVGSESQPDEGKINSHIDVCEENSSPLMITNVVSDREASNIAELAESETGGTTGTSEEEPKIHVIIPDSVRDSQNQEASVEDPGRRALGAPDHQEQAKNPPVSTSARSILKPIRPATKSPEIPEMPEILPPRITRSVTAKQAQATPPMYVITPDDQGDGTSKPAKNEKPKVGAKSTAAVKTNTSSVAPVMLVKNMAVEQKKRSIAPATKQTATKKTTSGVSKKTMEYVLGNNGPFSSINKVTTSNSTVNDYRDTSQPPAPEVKETVMQSARGSHIEGVGGGVVELSTCGGTATVLTLSRGSPNGQDTGQIVCAGHLAMTQSGPCEVLYCNFCQFVAKSQEKFIQHVLSHIFMCAICGFKCFQRYEVIAHVRENHPQRISEYVSFYPYHVNNIQVMAKGQVAQVSSAASSVTVSQAGIKSTVSRNTPITKSVVQAVSAVDKPMTSQGSQVTTLQPTSLAKTAIPPSQTTIVPGQPTPGVGDIMGWYCLQCNTFATTANAKEHHMKHFHKGMQADGIFKKCLLKPQGAKKQLIIEPPSPKKTGQNGSVCRDQVAVASVSNANDTSLQLTTAKSSTSLSYPLKQPETAKPSEEIIEWGCTYCSFSADAKADAIKHVVVSHFGQRCLLVKRTKIRNKTVIPGETSVAGTTLPAQSATDVQSTHKVLNNMLQNSSGASNNDTSALNTTNEDSKANIWKEIENLQAVQAAKASVSNNALPEATKNQVSQMPKTNLSTHNSTATASVTAAPVSSAPKTILVPAGGGGAAGKVIYVPPNTLQRANQGQPQVILGSGTQLTSLLHGNTFLVPVSQQGGLQGSFSQLEPSHMISGKGRMLFSNYKSKYDLMIQSMEQSNKKDSQVVQPGGKEGKADDDAEDTNDEKLSEEDKEKVVVIPTENEIDLEEYIYYSIERNAFCCKKCAYVSHSSYGANMRQHIRRHTGEKKWECVYCDYACNLRTMMKGHQSKVHAGATERFVFRQAPHCTLSKIKEKTLKEAEKKKEEEKIAQTKGQNKKGPTDILGESGEADMPALESVDETMPFDVNSEGEMPALKIVSVESLSQSAKGDVDSNLMQSVQSKSAESSEPKGGSKSVHPPSNKETSSAITGYGTIPEKDYVYHCKYCNFIAAKKKTVIIHQGGHHQKLPHKMIRNKRQYQCLHCVPPPLIRANIFKIKSHMKLYHPGEELVVIDLFEKLQHKMSKVQLCPVDKCPAYFVFKIGKTVIDASRAAAFHVKKVHKDAGPLLQLESAARKLKQEHVPVKAGHKHKQFSGAAGKMLHSQPKKVKREDCVSDSDESEEQVAPSVMWKCSHCSWTSKSLVRLKAHQSSDHPGEEEKYTQVVRAKSSPTNKSKDSPKENKDQISTKNEEILSTDTPDTQLMEEDQLKPKQEEQSEIKVEPDEEVKKIRKGFQCPKCDFTHNSWKQVKKHWLPAHPGGEEKYILITDLSKQASKGGQHYVYMCSFDKCFFVTSTLGQLTNDVEHFIIHTRRGLPCPAPVESAEEEGSTSTTGRGKRERQETKPYNVAPSPIKARATIKQEKIVEANTAEFPLDYIENPGAEHFSKEEAMTSAGHSSDSGEVENQSSIDDTGKLKLCVSKEGNRWPPVFKPTPEEETWMLATPLVEWTGEDNNVVVTVPVVARGKGGAIMYLPVRTGSLPLGPFGCKSCKYKVGDLEKMKVHLVKQHKSKRDLYCTDLRAKHHRKNCLLYFCFEPYCNAFVRKRSTLIVHYGIAHNDKFSLSKHCAGLIKPLGWTKKKSKAVRKKKQTVSKGYPGSKATSSVLIKSSDDLCQTDFRGPDKTTLYGKQSSPGIPANPTSLVEWTGEEENCQVAIPITMRAQKVPTKKFVPLKRSPRPFGPFKCKNCSFKVPILSEMKEHLAIEHTDLKDWFCVDIKARERRTVYLIGFCKVPRCNKFIRRREAMEFHLGLSHADEYFLPDSLKEYVTWLRPKSKKKGSQKWEIVDEQKQTICATGSPQCSVDGGASEPNITEVSSELLVSHSPDGNDSGQEAWYSDEEYDPNPKKMKKSHSDRKGTTVKNVKKTKCEEGKDERQPPNTELYSMPFMCYHCSLPTFTKDDLKTHLRQAHSTVFPVGIDLNLRAARQPAHIFYCPQEDCSFVTGESSEFSMHSHITESQRELFNRIQESMSKQSFVKESDTDDSRPNTLILENEPTRKSSQSSIVEPGQSKQPGSDGGSGSDDDETNSSVMFETKREPGDPFQDGASEEDVMQQGSSKRFGVSSLKRSHGIDSETEVVDSGSSKRKTSAKYSRNSSPEPGISTGRVGSGSSKPRPKKKKKQKRMTKVMTGDVPMSAYYKRQMTISNFDRNSFGKYNSIVNRFNCLYCDHRMNGIHEVKDHLHKLHPAAIPKFNDYKQKLLRKRATIYLCPVPQCASISFTEITNETHLCPVLDGDPNSSPSFGTDAFEVSSISSFEGKDTNFECLYCMWASNSESEMKNHLIISHATMEGGYREIQNQDKGET